MSTTSIEWTDRTWNPVTGCTKVSPGCDHCYAEGIARRFAGGPAFPNGFDVTLHPERLEAPLRWRKPARVFVNSMSDLFHDQVPDEFIARVWAVMAATPQHTYQILTKRHGRMRSLLRKGPQNLLDLQGAPAGASWNAPWPLPNVWLGVSVEDQKRADLRIPALLDTPAAVRFLSCEPLLGPVDLTPWMPSGHVRWQCSGCRRFYAGDLTPACPGCGREGYLCGSHVGNGRPNGQPLSWVIAGGESGPKARPMHPAWARQLRDQCQAAGVPFFFKQWGEWAPAPWVVRVCDPEVGWTGTTEQLADAQRRAEAEGASISVQWDGHVYRPTHKPWSLERVGDSPGAMRKAGKKAAGRVLDGRTWEEFPTEVPS